MKGATLLRRSARLSLQRLLFEFLTSPVLPQSVQAGLSHPPGVLISPFPDVDVHVLQPMSCPGFEELKHVIFIFGMDDEVALHMEIN